MYCNYIAGVYDVQSKTNQPKKRRTGGGAVSDQIG
jgi:hypothetical protein